MEFEFEFDFVAFFFVAFIGDSFLDLLLLLLFVVFVVLVAAGVDVVFVSLAGVKLKLFCFATDLSRSLPDEFSELSR